MDWLIIIMLALIAVMAALTALYAHRIADLEDEQAQLRLKQLDLKDEVDRLKHVHTMTTEIIARRIGATIVPLRESEIEE